MQMICGNMALPYTHHLLGIVCLCVVLTLNKNVNGQVNVALNKPASQTSDLDFNSFLWTADRAVDGCLLQDDAENQECCSSSLEVLGDNFWRVDLEETVLVEAITVLGRSDTSTQLENFRLFRQEVTSGPEVLVYDNLGVEYSNGNFTIVLSTPVLAQYIVIRRAGILTICEVQVYAETTPPTTTTTTITSTTTASMTSDTPIDTSSTTLSVTDGPSPLETTATESTDTNVALNKPATQFSTLDYLFFWTADKAVDGCLDRDDPDNQQCCSATEGGADNFWTVNLQQQYLVSRIIVTGRLQDFSNQLENFEVYTDQEDFFPELRVYTNVGQPYDDGVFIIDIQDPSPVQYVTLRRPTGTIMVICEVEVYAVSPTTTTVPTTTTSTTSTTSTTPVTTTEVSCPPFTYVNGELCSACGNCLNGEPCDQTNGICPSGCAAGYFGTICDLECPSGLYGPGCLGLCGNCFNNEACDRVTGQCLSGCQDGWTGPLCDQSTPIVTSSTVASTTLSMTDEASTMETTTTESIDTNVALNKPATQFSTLDYLFFWTADKAVDGCLDRDDPDNQQCCSATEGGADNFWTVNLQQQYLVSRIIVTGRLQDFSNQLENFEVYTRQEDFFPELRVYTNVGQPYDDGVFIIDIQDSSPVQYVTLRRPTGTIMVICEVEVYAVSPTTTTVPTTTTSTTSTTSTTPVTTTEVSCPPFTYVNGELCSACGNCLNGEPCDQTNGICPSGCAAGYFGTICDLECPSGLYGPGCLGLCGNCFNNEACDRVTGQCLSGCQDGWTGPLCDQSTPIVTSSTVASTTLSMTDEASTMETTTTESTDTNVALNKPATQFSTLDYLFFWTADKAVDGCLDRDDPDNQQCCSATEGGADNFWTVNLQQQYLVSRIIVTGRLQDFSNQLENFEVYTRQEDFFPEHRVYTNVGQPYDDGVFIIDIQDPSPVQYVTLRRPTGTIMVICEVEVYAVSPTTTTVPTTTTSTTSTTSTTPVTTTEVSCPPFTYVNGELCSACGNCLNGEPCDQTNGICPSGCAAGYFGTICDLECPSGLYGPGCLGLCGNCFNNEACDRVTGQCLSGCQDGWTGPLCDQSTPIVASSTVASTTLSMTDEASTIETTTTESTDTNVALNKPATQFSTLDYLFFWTADKAVDGCLDRDDPDNQQCCSATEGGADNFWTVNLQQQYLVSRIIVTGRLQDFSNQLENFEVYTRQEDFFPELRVYTNVGQPYDDGVFIIDIQDPSPVQYVTLRRPTGTIMVICEVEVYAVSPTTTTSSTTTTSTTSTTPATTTEAGCPPFTYVNGELCSACGNCLNGEPCDQTNGICPSGCASGYFDTICDLECPAGLYGPGCLGLCGNCFNNEACDRVTGQCLSGCQDGWTGPLCDQSTPTVTSSTVASTTLSMTDEPSTIETTTTESTDTNVALNKPATQFSTLDYLFFWTADKAVDGCLDRDDPDNQQCCSATEGEADNFWTVNLQQQYLVSRIIVTGRFQDFSNQLENFEVYTRQEDFFPELRVYTNVGQPYDDGVFIIDIQDPSLVQYVTLRRPTGTIMVICEVEVYAVSPTTTTSSTTTTSTTSTTPATTTEAGCPPFTYVNGELCSTCGNCLNGEPCDQTNGICPSGCASGYFGTICDLECPAGLYGPGCLGLCGNCFNNEACDRVTGQCLSGCQDGWTGPLCDQSTPIVTSSTVASTTLSMTDEPSTMETNTTESTDTNVALNKPATQFSTLEYLFFWTADKAVDGCLDRDDPDNQQCCSATEGEADNFWTVNLQQQYLVTRIIVTGRLQDNSNQLENFEVYTQQDEFFPELRVYTNVGQPYDDGVFIIDIQDPSPVQYVTLRRPTGTIMVICEVEVYAVESTTTSPTQTPTLTSTQSSSQAPSTTQSPTPTQSSSQVTTQSSSQATTQSSSQATTQSSSQATTQSSSQATTQSSSAAPTQSSSAAPTQSSSSEPTQSSSSAPTQSSSSAPTQSSSQTTTQSPSSAQTQSSSSAPTQSSSSAPTQISSQATTQSSSSAQTQSSSSAPTQSSSSAPTQSSSQATTQSSSQATTQSSSSAPTQSSSSAPTQSSSSAPTQSSSSAPTQSSSQAPTQISTQSSSQSPTQSSMQTPLSSSTTDFPIQRGRSTRIAPLAALLVINVVLFFVQNVYV